MSERIKILTKELKKIGGNWGGPSKDQKHIKAKKIKMVNGDEPVKYKKKKKKKTAGQKRNKGYNYCPHCSYKLRDYNFWIETRADRVETCKGCGAKLEICPCCKKDTWVKDNSCKHNEDFQNCGYMGKFEKVRDEDYEY